MKRIEKLFKGWNIWKKRISAAMACIVVFVTVYALVLPAITLDQNTADQDEGIGPEEFDDFGQEDFDTADFDPEDFGAEDFEEDSQNSVLRTFTLEWPDAETKEALRKAAEAAAASGEEKEEIKEINYTVTASFDEFAGFPEDVSFQAAEIEKDTKEYEEYYKRALDVVRKEAGEEALISYARFFDIAFLDGGYEIEPGSPVSILIEYEDEEELKAEDAGDLNVIHFDKTDPENPAFMENIEITETFGQVESIGFESGTFSVYGVVKTGFAESKEAEETEETEEAEAAEETEKEEGGEQYSFSHSMLGGESIMLSELLEKACPDQEDLQIGNVTDVAEGDEVSDSRASRDGDFLQVSYDMENGDYEITASPDQGNIEGKEGALTVLYGNEAAAVIEIIVSGQAEVDAGTAVITSADGIYLPDSAEGKAEELAEGEMSPKAEEAADTGSSRTVSRVFDISLNLTEEEQAAYEGGFLVNLTLPDEVTGRDFHLYHIHGGLTEELAIEKTGTDPDETGLETVSAVQFVTESFSEFLLQYTVDFEYSVNGKIYQFSLPGGGFVSFTDLVEVLGIIGDTNSEESGDENGSVITENSEENAANEAIEENGVNSDTNTPLTLGNVEVSDAAKKFVADVASVEFSSPELVDVSKVEADTTVGQIKDSRELECEYSAELTQEQIAEINAQTVEAGDWALIGVHPFLSEETLTVTMKNGEVFTILVTDAQLKKTVISALGETIEVVVTYDDSAEIPEGATLEITEFSEDSEEYQDAREAVVDKKQSEDPAFDDEEFGVAAFDLSIVDEDGNKVEPKAAVDVSMKMKSLPEEAAEENVQYSFEIHHLNESSGDVAVENVASVIDGSIQIEEESAQAEFLLESFSTFTISWSENTNETSTSARWTNGNNGSWVYITVNYVDENGNAIRRPQNLGGVDGWQQGNNGWTVNHSGLNGNGDYRVPLDIQSVLAKEIPGRTFLRAYINVNGNQIDVDSVISRRNTNWGGYTDATYFSDGQMVHQNQNNNGQTQGTPIYLEYSGEGPHTTIHYGYMNGDTFVEFDEQPGPTDTTTSFGWAHLIYDFAGTDDQGLHVDWKYSGTYYHTSETTNPEQGGTAMQPILRYYNNAWRYYNGNISSQNDTRNNSNWKAVADGSDIYVVYEKPVIPMGGTPSPSENSPQPDTPYILKESVSNTDGTNTLSLSVTGSRKPMITEKVADVIVILDLSSSMRRDIGSQTAYDSNYQTVTNSRYYQAKNAVQKLADRLYAVNGTDGEQYRMGLITFSNYAGRTYLSPTENQSTFQSTLDGITAYEGSGTNWEHALQLANQMSVASDRATYIVFITDGEPSVRQTRGNLTNEQLSGANWTNNPAIEGDIFHGGLAGGQFFPNNNDHNTPDFRDYFGSATFGGLMNNDVWDPRNRNAAVDEVASMLGHNKGFYAIGVSSDVNYLGDFTAAAGVDANHYKLVTSSTAFDEVIDDILEELDINGVSGQANVKVYDGITDLTQTIAKVNQKEGRLIGANGNFKYYKSNAPEGWSTWTADQKAAYALGVEYAHSTETPTEYASYTQDQKDAYELGKTISFTEWITRQADGCAEAVYNTETGAVEWNMGQTFMLEDGVTYKVSFICWPSQEAYDIIAKLNNGTITFGDTDLYPQEIWDQFDGDITNGYTLKTNAEGANTKYSKATNVNGNVTVGDEQDPLLFQHVPPMPLDKDKLNVAKTWQASRIDSQMPESVILQVVGDDELYKQFEITPTDTVDGSDTPNKGRSENIYISCGHLKVNKNTGEVVIYESGHDFTLREVGVNSRHWDLDASICRPMKINMEETMLVLVEEDDVPSDMKNNLDLAYLAENGNEYYRVDGTVYKVDEALTEITGFNTRRSFLDLAKEVMVDDEVWTDPVDEKFTYKIKINVDPTTLSWDPDLEKYIIISIRGDGYTPAAAVADETYPTTAVLPSQSGMDPSLIHDHYDDLFLVAESGFEFYLSIKNGWSVRFLNLPAGTTYSIEEVLPVDSNYDFNNVRLETRKESSSATPVSTDTYTTLKLDGSIEETSTLYKVVYQNDAKTKEVQILKTGQDASNPLGGAKFDLYTESAYTSNPKGMPYKTNLISSNETATKGKIDLGELPIGTYYLMETEAPDGYIIRTDPVVITVSKTTVTYDDGTTLSQSGSGISQIGDVYQLKVTNDEGVALPNTGGPGTQLFTILGSILILGAGVLLWRRRRLI